MTDSTFAKATVFVVDDDQAMRNSLKWLIESVGVGVESFASADEFLAQHQPGRTGCLVLDVRMPGMDGLTAYERLKEINPEVKIILSSGYSLTGVVKKMLDKGCDEYIQKPFSLSQISRITRELLDKP